MKFEKTKIYGVSGIGANQTLTRTDDAVGLGWDMPNEEEYISDFDYCYPWCDMQEVTDENGNVFIKIPKFYAKITDEGSNGLVNTYKYQISGCRYEGFSTLFIDGKGNEIDYVLVGKYEGSIESNNTKIMSKPNRSGMLARSDISLARTWCRNWGAGYQQYDFLIDWIIKLLFTVEFATTSSQSFLMGNVADLNELRSPGASDLIRMPTGASGRFTDDTASIKYRGIENPWGNLKTWCDGIYFYGADIFLCTDPTEYSHTTDTTGKLSAPYFFVGSRPLSQVAYTKAVTPFRKIPLLGFTSEISTNGFQENDTVYGTDGYSAWPAYQVGDDFWNKTGNALICGGHASYAGGLWCWSDNSRYYYVNPEDAEREASAIQNANNVGCRLCYKPI
jgi:hypothetical protein